MKLVSFLHAGRSSYGVVVDGGIVDAAPFATRLGATLKEALERESLGALADHAARADVTLAFADVELLPVIPDPQKILCVGINYLSHVKETGREVPDKPMIFARFADSQTAHDAPIVRPSVSERLDFEGELAVVIGRRASREGGGCIRRDRRLCLLQRRQRASQFTPGKNFPQTGGFGPWLVTRDEVGDPSRLSLTTRLNGEVMPRATTDDLIFPIPQLIEYCSTFCTLLPGDGIITGTTGGVGAFRDPPLWMKAGDVVEVEISRIGTLRNQVADEM
ncbi:2-keto-4-pentenoate hydratase/2-oxohepta-3-ene-1,7-dioic acid hydratase [Burkholderia sp. Ch1-1]|uniref:Fumarylacetoacetate (FAA) hydrolase n=1 Tax=Paraburkholderia dioscoreae TaxID=2604047 RepID=A0A5Q4ZFY5_9BURK|nr:MULTISPECIES: fumarylacetoacetate hydrolase family protein [Paraburkholderia]EIF33017.1 2-keto-4-pentenoate hydratase/2-oxohepta-3-ene-1,7-dioic acid hydratase [Burkholderia sp. Ch1-1]MDR8401987.1 fumarylacetoacetate hydrolase family protein [Paraburkholderia sp. USG1]VVD31853.1 Putative fumarylacetoacetate (FAA) hydrolase [Paraburkholderia dioscoreae]